MQPKHNYTEDLNKAPYGLFVLPSISKQLQMAGLTTKIILFWDLFKHGNTDAYKLGTFFWDADAYYKSADTIINAVCKVERIPAYSLHDIDFLLPPDYLLERNANGYTISLNGIWHLRNVSNKRLADCYGLMLLQMIANRCVSVSEMNSKIERNYLENTVD